MSNILNGHGLQAHLGVRCCPLFESRSCSSPELSHYQVRDYLRSYASFLHINRNNDNPAAAYNTRVERAEKRVQDGEEQGWRLWLKALEPTGQNTYRATWWTEVCLPSRAHFTFYKVDM